MHLFGQFSGEARGYDTDAIGVQCSMRIWRENIWDSDEGSSRQFFALGTGGERLAKLKDHFHHTFEEKNSTYSGSHFGHWMYVLEVTHPCSNGLA